MFALNEALNIGKNLIHPEQLQKKSELTQESFIKLLIKQLQSQTPDSPFDSNTMMQQISQLTNLSASQNMQKTVQELNDTIGSSKMIAASQLVGKYVQVPSSQSTLIEDKGLKGSLMMPTHTKSTTISIEDMSGRLVKTIELGENKSGIIDFSWDGKNSANLPCPPGTYKISAISQGDNGESNLLDMIGTVMVNSISVSPIDNSIDLNLANGEKTKLDKLIKIM